ncbi:MAG: hypothetical protein LCH86_24630 [Proteobacteria bacterium]|nr:hypothetical protein [Pseudomonadota bacterium]
MSRTLSCLIWRIVVAKSGKWTENAFEPIEFITTQFRQVDCLDWPYHQGRCADEQRAWGHIWRRGLGHVIAPRASALLSRMTFSVYSSGASPVAATFFWRSTDALFGVPLLRPAPGLLPPRDMFDFLHRGLIFFKGAK